MKRISLALVALLTMTLINAQQDIADKYVKGTHTHEGVTLPYRFFTPEDLEETKKYPVVLALHGGGARGTDNEIQMRLTMATVWADTVNQENYPCYVVVPQCSGRTQWRKTSTIQAAIDLLDSLAAHNSIDTTRMYITGQSMGGQGTWKAISHFPGKFAAAVILAGNMNTDSAHLIGNTPIWNFHGSKDAVIQVSGSRKINQVLEEELDRYAFKFRNLKSDKYEIIEQQLEIQQDLLYAELFGRAHDIFDESFDYPYLIPWVFSKTQRRENSLNFQTPGIDADSVYLEWNNEYPGDSVELWFSHDNGTHWELIDSGLIDTKYSVSKYDIPDCFAGVFRINAKDSLQRFYSYDEYRDVRIDTERNGLPYVKITSDYLFRNYYVSADSIDLQLVVNDTEDNDLTVKVYVSSDFGETYNLDSEFTTALVTEPISEIVYLNQYPETRNTIIKVTVSDGEAETADKTYAFWNLNGYDPNGINERETAVAIYPNPASEKINILLPDFDHVEVYNLQGKLMNVSSEKELDLSGYRAGMYILRIHDRAGRSSAQKLILQK